MQTIQHGYQAIGLLVSINWDRFLFPTAILAALMTAAYLGSISNF
jgi:hypothetical protein